MKKLLLLIFVAFIHSTFIFSQVRDKATISLKAGPAFSTGHFASTNLYDESSGFAKTGETISLFYAKPIAKKIAFLINASGQRNPINRGAFEASFSKAKIYQGFYFGSDPNNPPPQTSYEIYPNWTFEKSSWLYAALQLGAEGRFPLNEQKNIQLIINVTVGSLYATSPGLKGNSITDTSSATLTQSKGSAFGLIYSIACGLNYHLNKRYFITSALNYTGTNEVTFKNVKTVLTTTKGNFGTPGYSVQQSTTTANGKQAITSINLLIGFGISL